MALQYPQRCLRGLKTCRPYGQIESSGDNPSFICCGKNDGSMCPIPQDVYTLCFHGENRDDMTFHDRRDLTDQMYVIAWAMSHIELDSIEEKVATPPEAK